MGLDMYLTARRTYYTSFGSAPPKVVEVPDSYVVRAVEVEVVYWRKANAIHAWFVKNVQGDVDQCEAFDITGEQLLALRHLCADLLLNRDLDVAAEKLPPKAGFFFGSTGIDGNYWSDLQYTVASIDKALAAFPAWVDGVHNPDALWDYKYQSSW